MQPFRRRIRAGLTGWAVTVAMLDWHLGMLETEDGVARNLGPADAATLTRAWLTPAVADSPSPALCALGFATDVADGQLARATAPTRLGRDLEGLVDMCFSVAALCGAHRDGRAGQVTAVTELTRLAAGLAFMLTVYFAHADAPDHGVIHAGRHAGLVRAAGVLCACAGRRREADALLALGSLAGVIATARAYRAPRHRTSAAA